MKSVIAPSKFQLLDRVHVEPFEAGAIIVDLAGNRLYESNAVGKHILQSLHKGATEDELISSITTDFEIDRQRAEVDVRRFLEMLDLNHWLEKI